MLRFFFFCAVCVSKCFPISFHSMWEFSVVFFSVKDILFIHLTVVYVFSIHCVWKRIYRDTAHCHSVFAISTEWDWERNWVHVMHCCLQHIKCTITFGWKHSIPLKFYLKMHKQFDFNCLNISMRYLQQSIFYWMFCSIKMQLDPIASHSCKLCVLCSNELRTNFDKIDWIVNPNHQVWCVLTLHFQMVCLLFRSRVTIDKINIHQLNMIVFVNLT